jgi:peptidoglycan/LPS O-acetylase OafA/YrhL
MAGPVSSQARGGALDALRFFAALFVLAFHYGDEAPVALRELHGFFTRGYLATDFFLLLSGFVLARAYGAAVLNGAVSHGRFIAKRLARNYPAHLITLTGLVLAVATSDLIGHHLSNPGRFAWSAIPAQLLLIQGWGVEGGTWNVPSWTISALIVCYAVFPWLWRVIKRIEQPAACLTLALAVILGGDLLSHLLAGQEQVDLPFRWGILRAAPLFLAGLALARFVETARLGGWPARVVGLGGVGAFVADAVLGGSDLLAVLATAAVIIGCGAAPSGRRWPGAAWGAKLSFCLFLTHTLTGAIYFDVIGPVLLRLHPTPALQWVIWAGGVGFALGAAAAFHHLIDAPIQRRFDRSLFSPRPAPGPATAQSV